MQRSASTFTVPKGYASSSGTYSKAPSTGHTAMQTGEPAQPVQESLTVASILFFCFFVFVMSVSDLDKGLGLLELFARVDGGRIHDDHPLGADGGLEQIKGPRGRPSKILAV